MVRWMGVAVAVVGLAGCLGGGGEGGAGGDGGTAKVTCAQIAECAMECGDDPCVDACSERGDAAARRKFEIVTECLLASECQDMSCLFASCAEEATACGLKPPEDTALDCVALDACVQACEWDESCMQDDCFANTDEATATVWLAVYECADESGCQDQACVEESCAAELTACSDDGGSVQ